MKMKKFRWKIWQCKWTKCEWKSWTLVVPAGQTKFAENHSAEVFSILVENGQINPKFNNILAVSTINTITAT